VSAQALALVLTAALLHALWNIAAKKAGGDSRFALIAALMTLVLWAPVGAWAGWHVVPIWSWPQWGIVLASALVHLAYFTCLLRGYRLSDLTVVYPVARGSGPLLSSMGAVLILGEHMGWLGLAGVLCVTFGVFLIAGGPGLWRRAHDLAQDRAQRHRVHVGLRYGAMTGAFIAGYTLIDGYAVKVMLISPLLVDYFGNVVRVPFLLLFLGPIAWRDWPGFEHAWRSQWRYALVVAVLGPVGYVMVLYAVQMAPLSHVAPAREVSMLFATLIGGKLLGESDRGWRLAGAACIAAGVVSLALG
jgi:drug/metabolite transporter (DMT)-like permease